MSSWNWTCDILPCHCKAIFNTIYRYTLRKKGSVGLRIKLRVNVLSSIIINSSKCNNITKPSYFNHLQSNLNEWIKLLIKCPVSTRNASHYGSKIAAVHGVFITSQGEMWTRNCLLFSLNDLFSISHISNLWMTCVLTVFSNWLCRKYESSRNQGLILYYFVARPDDSETERMSCFRWPFGHRRRTKS